jgi:hypothetical protein
MFSEKNRPQNPSKMAPNDSKPGLHQILNVYNFKICYFQKLAESRK